MPDLVCLLVRMAIGHPDKTRIEDALAALGFDDEGGLVRIVDAPRIGFTALVGTPQGERTLTSSEA